MPNHTEAARAEARKPNRALPTDRAGFDKQMEILGAYGAIGADDGVTSTAVGKVVGAHLSTVSVCTPFFAESGLLERVGTGYKAAKPVVAYHAALEWERETAGHKLSAVLRDTWYWKALQPRLSFRPLDEADGIRILADECKAGPNYRAQIKLVIDFLEAAGLVAREGSLLRKGPMAGPSQEQAPATRTAEARTATDEISTRAPDTGNGPTTTGISFDASIRVTEREIGSWSPEQIREFFSGLAAVISAKALAEKHQ
jgi:hypothetical protein